VIIGTAGHIDHGKTALVHALTGVDTDRLKEEKARGISIDLGFAYLPTDDGSVLGFVDVPGHEKFVRNMLAGAAGIDFVLLVVAADDGVMPQTVEHLAIVDLLGTAHGIVALTKVDLVSAARREEVAQEIRHGLGGTRLAQVEIIPVSTVTGEGIAELRGKLFAASCSVGVRATQGRFRLAVDRCFTLTGAGTVVTGTVLSGAVAIGDPVMLSPSGLSARVRSIHAQNRPTKRGHAGERCALNLVGDAITKSSIGRGDVVLDPELHAPTDRVDAMLRVLACEPKPIGHWMPVRLYHAATEVGARVALLEDMPIRPGASGRIQLVLDQPTAAAAGDRYVLRDTSGRRTIGGGRFLDLRAPARKRRTPERLAQLDAHALADPQQSLSALIERWPFYVDLTAFARDHALTLSEVENMAERLGVMRAPAPSAVFAFSTETWRRLARNLLATLDAFHAANPELPGIGTERLRLLLEPRLPVRVLSCVLQALAHARDVAFEGGSIRLPGHQVNLTTQDGRLWSKIAPFLSGAERFRPPRGRDIAELLQVPETGIRRVLKSLSRQGKVIEMAPDHFFLRETALEMADIAADIAAGAADGQFTAAQFRDRMDNGRKVAIQILEFFDRHGVTARRGDLRRVNSQRLDLFRRRAGGVSTAATSGGESSPVGRPDFKSGRGRQPVLGGFDPHSLPPRPRS
jgi:selenocysteine-specific elongation factor